MNFCKIKMVATDLDGTLLTDNKSISKKDFNTLKLLKKYNICRIIATGRSLYSAKKVLNDDFPVDYLIFTSGAGIFDWKSKKIIRSKKLSGKKVSAISDILIKNQVNFMIHKPIPDNHKFIYYKTNKDTLYTCDDFDARCYLYNEFAIPAKIKPKDFGDACQIVAIIPNDLLLFQKIKQKFEPDLLKINIIRTTSPLNKKSIWIEFLPNKISKANSVEWLCNKIGINQSESLSIGNDYNDIDLLKWTKHSFVVSNAPDDIKNQFTVSKSNTNSGFTNAIIPYLWKI